MVADGEVAEEAQIPSSKIKNTIIENRNFFFLYSLYPTEKYKIGPFCNENLNIPTTTALYADYHRIRTYLFIYLFYLEEGGHRSGSIANYTYLYL